MKTAVLDSGFAGSSRQTTPLVLEPARKAARKPKRVVVPFSISKPKWEVPDARIQVPKPVVWERLELGFVTVLLASAGTLIAIAVSAAANL
ncbi:MAG: hypothetical protein JOZ31_01790 [Verrucomicrobia bacterium]|nr:hypothetical protein [Verrucomicrobiota bacterium]MBV8485859.1 hypothetical protein [Verrucomicrobiota bacterium]